MSAADVTETLTAIERATWIVDHAVIRQRPSVADNGDLIPVEDPAPEILATELMEQLIRPDSRGVRREGLTVRLLMILMIVAAGHGCVFISEIYLLATNGLPLEVQRELGILSWSNKNGKPQLRKLSPKQLYGMVDAIRKHLDVDPELELSSDQVAQRLAVLDAIKDAFLYATHVLPLTGTSVAIDESGIWSWVKGPRKPADLPLVDPTDEDANAAAQVRAKVNAAVAKALGLEVDGDEDAALDNAIDAIAVGDQQEPVDEDATTDATSVQSDPTTGPGSDSDTEPTQAETSDGNDESTVTHAKRGKRCWLAGWGVKTHKSGRRSAFFGYSLHALVRIPEIARGRRRATKAERYQEPLLIEEFALTAPSMDVVETSLDLVKKRFARHAPVGDLIGDRHYSYKKFDRWGKRLWALQVRPVLDLRDNDHRLADYEGAVLIAGTPHCQPPEHLHRIARPGKGASPAELATFDEQIDERQKYAMKRHKTAWSRNDGKPGGDGNTRWLCGGAAGTVGCPRIPGSVKMAQDNGLPIITPPATMLPFCSGTPVTVEPGAHMKYHQQEYWGSKPWLLSWNRRTYVEGVFGNMKNYATGNIHRGYMQFTGQALVTIGLTAAVVAYNLRELENWFTRASKHCPDNPLLDIYREHPLHQKTQWTFGFSMKTQQERAQWEQDWLDETQPSEAAPPLTVAA